MKFAFNGFLFSQRQTGVMRYAKEILLGIDKLCESGEFELVIPEYAKYAPRLTNIKVIRFGNTKGNMWEQKDFSKYLTLHHMTSVNFNNTMPFNNPGIIVIHDIAYKLHPEFGSSLHGKVSNIYHKLVFNAVTKTSYPIVTVSYFSKYQIIDNYHIAPERIYVISNGWQHVNQYGYDDSILDKYKLNNRQYYFSLGSLSKMKNTKWFIDVAKKQPDKLFVLAGAKSNSTGDRFDLPENVIAVGFISDEQVKSLIRNCKAFIYPSIYDGFGIPPMEALSQGANVICSNAACLPEIYRNSVHYIDPYNTDIDLDAVLAEKIDSAEEVLERYSWEKSAERFYCLLREQNEKEN